MLYVLAAGYAHPDIVLDNEFLAQLGLGLSAAEIGSKYGIQQRHTSLPLDYIKSTKNRDPREAPKVAVCTPTDLAVKATEMALARAGISAEQLGLIIGDCVSPIETTPSEAQRVGKRFGLKCHAYDVNAGENSFSAQLDALLSWNEERMPEYVLCVSTATMTHLADYTVPQQGCRYGDGAAALLISGQHASGLKLADKGIYEGALKKLPAVEREWGYTSAAGPMIALALNWPK